MENEYVIINKTGIKKRINELNETIDYAKINNLDYVASLSELLALKNVLSQSTPLIPEIEKVFNASKITTGMNQRNQFVYKYKTSQDYISNLKLDI